jgi:hypothetical protein
MSSVDTTQDTFKRDPSVRALLKQIADTLTLFNEQLE